MTTKKTRLRVAAAAEALREFCRVHPPRPLPPLAVLYLRTSTRHQSTENQLTECRRLCEARGLVVRTVYEEQLSTTIVRPELNRMVEAAHRGEFSVLVVWALDRLGRSMVENMQTVIELDRIGVQIMSVREPWLDTGGPVRSLLIAFFSWVAEQERVRLGERTRAGLDRARAKGIKLGRPRAHVTLSIARNLRAKGLTWKQVAKKMDVTESSLRRARQRKIP